MVWILSETSAVMPCCVQQQFVGLGSHWKGGKDWPGDVREAQKDLVAFLCLHRGWYLMPAAWWNNLPSNQGCCTVATWPLSRRNNTKNQILFLRHPHKSKTLVEISRRIFFNFSYYTFLERFSSSFSALCVDWLPQEDLNTPEARPPRVVVREDRLDTNTQEHREWVNK